MQKTSSLGNALIWFGAAVSIAEIYTGALLAPLGFARAAAAIVLGHLIGGGLLYCAGVIGARSGMTAMACAQRSFGARGGALFAALNLIQLLGWTAVMIAAGAQASHGVFALSPAVWSCIIGALIALWSLFNARELKWVNCTAATLLFALSVVLNVVIARRGEVAALPAATAAAPPLSFAAALELSIAMPLSWLPLIADYTCCATRPRFASTVCAVVYTLASGWMYFIGLGAALATGGADVVALMTGAGLGAPALLIVVFSTVSTTFLDVYSSGMSMQSITKKIPPRATGLAVCAAGVLMAVFCRTGAFEEFLYWIGSVFAPMIAIEIVDFFILKESGGETCPLRAGSLIVWGIGFALYRLLLAANPICGSTIPVMLATGALRIVCARVQRRADDCVRR